MGLLVSNVINVIHACTVWLWQNKVYVLHSLLLKYAVILTLKKCEKRKDKICNSYSVPRRVLKEPKTTAAIIYKNHCGNTDSWNGFWFTIYKLYFIYNRSHYSYVSDLITFEEVKLKQMAKTYPLKQSTDFNRFVFKMTSSESIPKKIVEHIRTIKKLGR